MFYLLVQLEEYKRLFSLRIILAIGMCSQRMMVTNYSSYFYIHARTSTHDTSIKSDLLKLIKTRCELSF